MDQSEQNTKIGEYLILDEISRGAMGIVYRAKRNDQLFALKVLRANDVESVTRFRKETASIARLSHPSLVRIVDANEIDGIPFIVMELLDGSNLSSVLQLGPIEKNLFTKIAVSISSALAEMHRYSMIHRDIKPANILVTNNEEVKLLDLGLAGDSRDLIEEDKRSVVGTILYSSPEQSRVLKRPIDGRSDLYSLGVTLYECLTGKCPFEHEDIGELMKMHAAIPAPDVRQIASNTSPVIAAIVGKLLEKDPDDRYQSAEGLKYDFEMISKLEATYKITNKIDLGSRDRLFQGASELPLAGRKRELEILKGYWSDAVTNRGRAVIIEGEGGCGKSRLTQELLNNISKSEIFLLRGKCQTHSSRLPYAPIREAFDTLLNRIHSLSPDDQKVWIEKLREAAAHAPTSISELSNGLKSILGEKSKRPIMEDDSDRQRFLEDLTIFFGKLAGIFQGTILLIDDIQWMDPGTAELLSNLCRHFSTTKFFVLLTSRNENPLLLNRFKESTLTLESSIVLGPLSINDIQEIVFAQLGTNSLDKFSVQKLATAANGNPLVITEYIRSLLNSGHLFYLDGKWQINAEGIATISLSNNVFQIVLDRINSLSKKLKETLSVAAVIGNTFDLETLIGTSNLNDDEVLSGIQIATQNNLVSPIEGQRYRFEHDRIREALLMHASSELLKSLNDRLAVYTDNLPGDKPWFEIARFYANGNVDRYMKRTFESNFEAGKLALANYAYQQAFELLTIALKCAQNSHVPPQQICLVARDLASASSESGHERQAYESIDLALPLTEDLESRVQCLCIKMKAYFNFGRLNLAWVTFKQILDLVERPYPRYSLFRWIQISWLMFLFISRAQTGFGFGWANHFASKRKKIESLSGIYLVGSHTARIRAGNDSLWIALQMCNLTHQLGPSVQFARSVCHLSTIFCNYRLKNVGEFLIKWAYSMVPASDAATLAYIKYFEMMTLINLDDDRFDSHHEQIGPEITRFLGPYEFSGWSNYRSLRYFHKGMHREALANIQLQLPKLEALGNKLFIANTLGEMPFHLAQLGDLENSLEIRRRLMRIIEADLKDEWASIAQYVHSEMYFAYEEGELGGDTDLQIESVRDFNWAFITNRLNFSNIAYIRLAQFEKAKTYEEKRRARILLKETLHQYFFKAFGPTAEAHLYIVKSGLLRCEGSLTRALALVEKAQQIGRAAENPLLIFRAIRERAKIYQALGDSLRVNAEATLCMTLSTQHGWIMRANCIQREFGIVAQPLYSGNSVSGKTIHRTSSRNLSNRSDRRTIVHEQSVTKEGRALAALTLIGLASTHSIDPAEQAHSVLKEIVKLFGAERSFLFLAEGENLKDQQMDPSLKLVAGQNADGQPLDSLKGYSSTVVRQAFTEAKPVIVTGTDEGRALGSESAVLHNLRSIMAVPIKVHDKIIGIVYLDSHLAKGLFTDDDIDLLSILANNIAVAFELSNKAKIELEKASLKHELQVQSAIATESKKVKMLVDNMQQALFSVEEGGLVVEPISKYSEKILGPDLVGSNILPLLFKNNESQKLHRDAMASAISTVFGEDELQWSFMESNIPKKIQYQVSELGDEESKVLRINSSPIWNDQGNLERILFVIEDISNLEALEKKLTEQGEQTAILESLLENELGDTNTFFVDALLSLERNEELNRHLDDDSFSVIVRDLHTLKGNSRLFKLGLIAQQVDAAEGFLESFKAQPRDYKAVAQLLENEFAKIKKVVRRYQEVLHKVYKPAVHSKTSPAVSGGSKIAIDQLNQFAAQIDHLLPNEVAQKLRMSVARLLYKSVHNMVARFDSMVADISKQLNKKVKLEITGEALIEKNKFDALNECLLHLIRNSLDHGLEEPSERVRLGKQEQGTIVIDCRDEIDSLTISIFDDGRGIDGDRVAESAIRKGLISEVAASRLSLEEKINLIFLPNFSTKENASDISGRGVGMDVVKNRVMQLNGTLSVSTKLGKGSTFTIVTKNENTLSRAGTFAS